MLVFIIKYNHILPKIFVPLGPIWNQKIKNKKLIECNYWGWIIQIHSPFEIKLYWKMYKEKKILE